MMFVGTIEDIRYSHARKIADISDNVELISLGRMIANFARTNKCLIGDITEEQYRSIDEVFKSDIKNAVNEDKNIIVEGQLSSPQARAEVLKLIPRSYAKEAFFTEMPDTVEDTLKVLRVRSPETSLEVAEIIHEYSNMFEFPAFSEGFYLVGTIKAEYPLTPISSPAVQNLTSYLDYRKSFRVQDDLIKIEEKSHIEATFGKHKEEEKTLDSPPEEIKPTSLRSAILLKNAVRNISIKPVIPQIPKVEPVLEKEKGAEPPKKSISVSVPKIKLGYIPKGPRI